MSSEAIYSVRLYILYDCTALLAVLILIILIIIIITITIIILLVLIITSCIFPFNFIRIQSNFVHLANSDSI